MPADTSRLRALLANPPGNHEEWLRLVGEEADRLEHVSSVMSTDPVQIRRMLQDGESLKVSIFSDGTPHGTFVRDAESGKPIAGITGLEWTIGLGRKARACLNIIEVPVEIYDTEAVAGGGPQPTPPRNR